MEVYGQKVEKKDEVVQEKESFLGNEKVIKADEVYPERMSGSKDAVKKEN